MNSLVDFNELCKMSIGCEKIKMYDTFQGQNVKFHNGRIWEVEADTADYDRFYDWLRDSRQWQLTPQVTSCGWVAKPSSEELEHRHQVAQAIDALNEELSGEPSHFADEIPWQGEPVEQPDEQEVNQAEINQQARLIGATHVSKFGSTFYRKGSHPHSIEICQFVKGEGFARWTRDSRAYIPEWAVVIAGNSWGG